MPDFLEKIASLNKAIGIRRDISQADIIVHLENASQPNKKLLNDFYADNPVFSRFIEILTEKQYLSPDKYEEKLESFYQKYPEYRKPAFQKQVFDSIRNSLPEGSLVKVKGGYAIMKTERRHGRSPNGTFPILSDLIKDVEDFAHTRGFITESEFLQVFDVMLNYLRSKMLYEVNRFVGQGELAIPVKVITDKPSQIAFAMNMFRATPEHEGETLEPWIILSAPGFKHPREERFIDGVFKFTDYKRRVILIGGSGYNGEIKKSMFSVANHIYPLKGHLSLHCSSVYNDKYKETTLIFGLSGTGKSTVSSGVEDVHVLSDDETAMNLDTGKTFNLENGNYYKTGGLLSEKKVLDTLENLSGEQTAIYENVVVSPSGHVVIACDPTGNGRVSVPISCLEGAISGGMYPLPKKIIILSRDVNAILDPMNILTKEQIVYYLKLGYTSKTPGTEAGVLKPIPTYSKWEGGPFYDLKDEFIMKMLFKFLDQQPVTGILLNSGEGGGPFGSVYNKRFPVRYTLEIARSFLVGSLMKHHYEHPEDFEDNRYLKTIRPRFIPDIPEEMTEYLCAENIWKKNGFETDYDRYAVELFTEFKEQAAESLANLPEEARGILNAGPV
ncbi:MAG: phosphoenolpyruvate carboxykinase (ATP) [Spirochaetia bacterium]|nr:phosphoenolpyruvate carboxykinase (ATP) [Spirochaetia bacterium]